MTDSFFSLGLSDATLAAVTAAGYTRPTDIQAKAIPEALAGRDIIGLAQTGTGKTAAFTLPIIDKLVGGRVRARMPRTLILEPTRELAAQVEQTISLLDPGKRLSVALLIGGVSFEQQEAKLSRGVDLLIATPGRLLDHFERGKLLMTGVDFFVIDEADRMLDMGFIPDIERIAKLLPPRRQTFCFSATMAPEIENLTGKFLRTPVRIQVASVSSTADTITQSCLHTGSDPKIKRSALRQAIAAAKSVRNAIIFCNRKRDVGIVARSLQRHLISAEPLHGDMDQHARMKTLEGFRNNDVQFLVASDVAARGLDIPEVSHVFNYDVPNHAEDYVHRIGRTGRAGREGQALTLVTPSDADSWQKVIKLIGKDVAVVSSEGTSVEAVAGHSERKKANQKSKPSRGGEATKGAGGREAVSHGRRSQPSPSGDRAAPPPEQYISKADEQIKGFGDKTLIPGFMFIDPKA